MNYKSTLIVPCAGKSTRFNVEKPKWVLTHPNGNLMLIQSIIGLDLQQVDRIVITVVDQQIKEHKIDIDKIIENINEVVNIRPEFYILNDFTISQSETVYKTIINMKITNSIFIKDCDNFFKTTINCTNSVCVSQLTAQTNAINKSYVSIDKFGYLLGIVEKKVIGDTFCVGGYSFVNVVDFINSYEDIIKINGIKQEEIYISHIIQYMLLQNKQFETQSVYNYVDWGTIENWYDYCGQYKTIFVDLDGVLVENGAEFCDPKWGETAALQNNVNIIKKLYDTDKVHIIITTSRKNEYKEITEKQLNKYQIPYHRIIFDLPHTCRILINDFSTNNLYPSAIAHSIRRNEDNLQDLIKGKL